MHIYIHEQCTTFPFLLAYLPFSQVLGEANNASVGNKRQRESKVDGSDGPRKIKAFEDLRLMGIRQLREQAILRGVSSSGSKKELLDRLCAESGKESKDVAHEYEGLSSQFNSKL